MADGGGLVTVLTSLVDGRPVDVAGPAHPDQNPARPDDAVATWHAASPEVIAEACRTAAGRARDWRSTPFHDRAAVLAGTARILEDRADDLGRELSREEGKPLAEGIGEVRRAARICDYYAAEADRAVGEIFSSPRRGEQILTRQVPVGPTALITPWNFPIAIPAWKLAPALAYGNTVVWKPSPVTPVLAVRLAEALREAGLPDGVLNVVLGGGDVGEAVLANPEIRACSFTGSTTVGRAVMAAGAQHDVKTQAEMGGVNVAVVLADADLDLAAEKVVAGATGSTGQKCTATSRLVVEESVQDALLERIVDLCDRHVIGDPLAEATTLGPLATPAQREQVGAALDDARRTGADVVRDGRDADLPEQGWFVAPSIVRGVGADHPLCTEEVFGPVLAVTAVRDRAEAFAEADTGRFGLTTSVFTRDLVSALAATEELEVGILHVNSETTGAEPHVPFGGVRASGAGGREQGRAARDFYTETRTIYLA
jgi:acyl-CoA reductase-like NAD-dependent aldehyde dehydrogenase